MLGNPLRFIDPDGMQVDDIIITGGDNPGDDRRILNQLQALTNDQLEIGPRGEVSIVSEGGANADKDLSSGTELIRSLISDNNNTVNIILDQDKGNGTTAVNPETGKEIQALPKEGVEYDANVNVNGKDPNTVNADGTRGLPKGKGAVITLGHELKHAQDLIQGNFDRSSLGNTVYDHDLDRVIPGGLFTTREYNTRVFENKLRNEQGLTPRALPKIVNVNED